MIQLFIQFNEGEECWEIKRSNAVRASFSGFKTQEEALEKARVVANQEGSEENPVCVFIRSSRDGSLHNTGEWREVYCYPA